MSRRERELGLQAALEAGKSKNAKGKAYKARKLAKEKPWKELRAEWRRQFKIKFGAEPDRGDVVDDSLFRHFVDRFGFDDAMKMVRLFIQRWDKRPFEGAPSVRLGWAIRQTLWAEIGGKANSKQKRLTVDEYADDAADPSEGWG